MNPPQKLKCIAIRIALLPCVFFLLMINHRPEELVAKHIQKKTLHKQSDTFGTGIRISEKTTFYTQPILPDGRVDYVTALNQHYKPKGLTPCKNGAVYFVKAIGMRSDQSLAFVTKSWTAIGLSEEADGFLCFPGDSDSKLVSLSDYINTQIKDLTGEEKQRRRGHLEKKLYHPQDGPWKKGNQPERWNWLQINKPSLDLLTKGTNQSLFFLPISRSSDRNCPPMVLSVLFPDILTSRSFAQLLHARALNYLAEGDHVRAARDLMTAHKLARQIGMNGIVDPNRWTVFRSL